MRTYLLACLGGVLGFVAGIAIPMFLSAMIDWSNDFEAGSSAGTGFALMTILTAPVGAGVGFIAGLIYSTYRD